MGLGDFFSSLFGSGEEDEGDTAEQAVAEGGPGEEDRGGRSPQPDQGSQTDVGPGGDDSGPDLG